MSELFTCDSNEPTKPADESRYDAANFLRVLALFQKYPATRGKLERAAAYLVKTRDLIVFPNGNAIDHKGEITFCNGFETVQIRDGDAIAFAIRGGATRFGLTDEQPPRV